MRAATNALLDECTACSHEEIHQSHSVCATDVAAHKPRSLSHALAYFANRGANVKNQNRSRGTLNLGEKICAKNALAICAANVSRERNSLLTRPRHEVVRKSWPHGIYRKIDAPSALKRDGRSGETTRGPTNHGGGAMPATARAPLPRGPDRRRRKSGFRHPPQSPAPSPKDR